MHKDHGNFWKSAVETVRWKPECDLAPLQLQDIFAFQQKDTEINCVCRLYPSITGLYLPLLHKPSMHLGCNWCHGCNIMPDKAKGRCYLEDPGKVQGLIVLQDEVGNLLGGLWNSFELL